MDETISTIKQYIESSDRILLHLHPSPDGDSVGSALAMYHVLHSMGKDVVVISGDDEPPEAFRALPGFEVIEHKNYFDIDISSFDLFIILDAASLDRVSRKGTIESPPTLKTVVIDHHASNSGFAQHNLILPSAPATAEILFELFEKWAWTITKEMAANLIVGIYTDTGCFRYPGTTKRTLEIFARLVEIYPEYIHLLTQLENTFDRAHYKYMELSLQAIEQYAEGKIILSTVSNDVLTQYGITQQHISRVEFVSYLRMSKDSVIAATLTEKKKGEVGISIRTAIQDRYDVSRIAKRLGGGGHKGAAGATVLGSVDEVKSKLLTAIFEEYPELKP